MSWMSKLEKKLENYTILITIVLAIMTLIAGYFAYETYSINGDYVELQTNYNTLNNTYYKNCVINSPNSVQSNNQQGGITAGTINVNDGAPPRHLSDTIIKELNDHLPSNKKAIDLLFYNDKEAHQFASEIKIYLESEGWEIDNFVAHIPNNIPPASDNGIIYEDIGETFLIEIISLS